MATQNSAYQRLVVSARQSAELAIKRGFADKLYSESSGTGGYFQGQETLAHAEKQYTAAGRGWAYAAIRPVAVGVAKQPVRVGIQRSKKSRKDWLANKALLLHAPPSFKALAEQIDIQVSHPIIDLIENPNPYMPEWALKYCTAFSMEATGTAYWFIYKDSQAGYRVYYLPTHWVRKALSDKTKLQIGWLIQPPGEPEGTPVPFSSILVFRYPDASDPGAGFSPLQSQAPAINTDEEIQTAQYSAMRNGINPGMVIRIGKQKHPGGDEYVPELTKEQRKQLITSIQSAMQGVQHWHDPIVLDNMIEDVFPYTRTAAEMDFLGGSKLTKERVTLGIGTNPIVMGQIENANRASSFVAHEGFYRLKVNPLLALIGETCTKTLAPLFTTDKRLYVWFDEAQARDEDLHLRQLVALGSVGALTKNEFREAVGLSPIADGDTLIVPRQQSPMGVGRPNST